MAKEVLFVIKVRSYKLEVRSYLQVKLIFMAMANGHFHIANFKFDTNS